jgi:tetrahydromethanopterin S-methyltransferase subunit G
MGFIEEGRQLIQDFVTPEIRSLDARLTTVEKKIESLEVRSEKRFDALDGKVDRVQTSLESRIDKAGARTEKELGGLQSKLNALDAKFDKNQALIMDSLHRWENIAQILERLARVESKLQHVA